MSVEDSDKSPGEENRSTPHIFKAFDEELDHLRSQILTMGSLVTQSTEAAFQGLQTGSVDRCNEVIADDSGD